MKLNKVHFASHTCRAPGQLRAGHSCSRLHLLRGQVNVGYTLKVIKKRVGSAGVAKSAAAHGALLPPLAYALVWPRESIHDEGTAKLRFDLKQDLMHYAHNVRCCHELRPRTIIRLDRVALTKGAYHASNALFVHPQFFTKRLFRINGHHKIRPAASALPALRHNFRCRAESGTGGCL
jgi:hypothetical protein